MAGEEGLSAAKDTLVNRINNTRRTEKNLGILMKNGAMQKLPAD